MYGQFYFCNPYQIVLPTYEFMPPTYHYPYPIYSLNHFPSMQNTDISEDIDRHTPEEQHQAQESQEQSIKSSVATKTKSLSKYKYAKKNVESNVINQCFSFMTTKGKSYEITLKVLKSQEKLNAFYEILKLGKKKNIKYMGRTVLQEFLVLEQDHPIYTIHKKLKYSISLKMSEIRKTLRILACYFLKTMITTTILTSSKLDKATIKEHLHRARQIYNYINQKPSLFI